MKKCTKCLNDFPITEEFFYKYKRSKDGFHHQCKTCMKKRSLNYYHDNMAERKIAKKEYYQRNQEKISEQQRNYRKNNWEVKQKYYKKWSNENKDKIKEYQFKRKSNKTHEISKKEWKSCLNYFNNSCAYCGISSDESLKIHNQVLHKEHVDHNGINDLSNNIPACRSCNSSKWIYEFDEWYNENNPVFSEERYTKILNWINNDYINYVKL